MSLSSHLNDLDSILKGIPKMFNERPEPVRPFINNLKFILLMQNNIRQFRFSSFLYGYIVNHRISKRRHCLN
jgi:hypothetical protein